MNGPPERVEAMWARYRRGASLAEVAAEFGVGFRQVSKLLNKHGYPVERAARRRDTIDRARRMYQQYEAGASIGEIAAHAGLTVSRVRQIFEEFDVPRDFEPGQHLTRRKAGRARAAAMFAAYEAGRSLEEVGRIWGISAPSVREAFLRYGFAPRRPGGPTRTSFGQPDSWRRDKRGVP